MGHWTEKWVGRPYVPGEFDCADLVKAVVEEVRGVYIPLPSDREWRGLPPDALRDLSREYAAQTMRPQEGDGVLMRIVGNRRSLGSHIGVYSEVAGSPWVLHSIEKLGVLFTPVSHLVRLQLEIQSYYQWLQPTSQ